MANLVKNLDNAISKLQDVRKKLNIQRLTYLKDSVLESVKSDVLCFDHWRIDSTAEIHHNGEIVGYVKYNASVEKKYGLASDDYDVPNDPDEMEIILNDISVTILGQNGNALTNITNVLNVELSKTIGYQIY